MYVFCNNAECAKSGQHLSRLNWKENKYFRRGRFDLHPCIKHIGYLLCGRAVFRICIRITLYNYIYVFDSKALQCPATRRERGRRISSRAESVTFLTAEDAAGA